MCFGSETWIRNINGRVDSTFGSVVRVKDDHHYGRCCLRLGIVPELSSHLRIVYIDVCMIR